MDKAIKCFEKNLLKISVYFILISLAGFFIFAYFYILQPFYDVGFIALFEKDSKAYPSRVMSLDKIIAGQEKRSTLGGADFSAIPDIFSARERDPAANLEEEGKKLFVGLAINGEGGMGTAAFDDALDYSVVYKNQGESALKNIEIKIEIDSTSENSLMILDWATLEDKNAGKIVGLQVSPEVRRGTITWTGAQIDQLRELAPGEEGEIKFKINFKSSSELSSWKAENFETKNTARVVFYENEVEKEENSDSVIFVISKGAEWGGGAVSP